MNWCPVCKEQIQLFAEKCPHCLSDLRDDDGDGIGFFGWIVMIVVFCYFFFGLYE